MRTLGTLARGGFIALLTVSLGWQVSSGTLRAQKNKKTGDASSASQPLPNLAAPDTQQIDHDIGEMLGAFQVGNVEAMHKYYSDQAIFVRGTFDPPVVGWDSYARLYEQQRAAFPAMQLIRRNTMIFIHQDVSWASYQWQFISSLNGKPFSTQGQTTLVLNKLGDNWLIVHNHTSEICPDTANAPVNPPVQRLAQPSPR